MRTIFLLYMPPNNTEVTAHYPDTIQEKVSLDRNGRYASQDVAGRLWHVFEQRPRPFGGHGTVSPIVQSFKQ